MDNRANYLTDLVMEMAACSEETAKALLERLKDEGFLHVGYGKAEVDIVLETYVEAFQAPKVTQADRYAANRLISRYGASTVVTVIKLMATKSGDKYAPVVGSIRQLEDKWLNVLAFLRKQQVDTLEV